MYIGSNDSVVNVKNSMKVFDLLPENNQKEMKKKVIIEGGDHYPLWDATIID
jgi:hypothetical protein